MTLIVRLNEGLRRHGARGLKINVVLVLIEIVLGERNDVAAGHTTVGSAAVLVLIVLEFEDELLDHRGVGARLDLPHGGLAHDGAVEGRGLGEDGHDTSTAVEASLVAHGEAHDMIPGKADELGGVVLVLNVVGFGVGVETLDVGKDPGTILVGSGDLGGDLLVGTGGNLGPAALAHEVGRGHAVEVGRIAGVVGRGGAGTALRGRGSGGDGTRDAASSGGSGRTGGDRSSRASRRRNTGLTKILTGRKTGEEAADDLFLIDLHGLKMPGNSDGQFGGWGLVAGRNTWLIRIRKEVE